MNGFKDLLTELFIYLKNVRLKMINKYKKIVIKIGSSSIINLKQKIKSKWIEKLCKDIQKFIK